MGVSENAGRLDRQYTNAYSSDPKKRRILRVSPIFGHSRRIQETRVFPSRRNGVPTDSMGHPGEHNSPRNNVRLRRQVAKAMDCKSIMRRFKSDRSL